MEGKTESQNQKVYHLMNSVNQFYLKQYNTYHHVYGMYK